MFVTQLYAFCFCTYITRPSSEVGRHFSKLLLSPASASGHIPMATKEVWALCYHLQHKGCLARWDLCCHWGGPESNIYIKGWVAGADSGSIAITLPTACCSQVRSLYYNNQVCTCIPYILILLLAGLTLPKMAVACRLMWSKLHAQVYN